MKLLRKYFAAFFLMIVSLPLVLSLLFAGEQICAHMEKKWENELCTIQVKKSEIIWIKENKEVVVQGKMFDVKSIKDAGNFVELYGYYDEAEDKLFSFFYTLFAEDETDEIGGQQLLSFVFYSENTSPNNYGDFIFDGKFKTQYPLITDPALLRRSEEIISPPPNFL